MSKATEAFLVRSLEEFRRSGALPLSAIEPRRGQLMLPLDATCRFYETSQFPWSRKAEAMSDAITRQVLSRCKDLNWKSVFAKYVTRGAWHGCYLSAFGTRFGDLDKLPLVEDLLHMIPGATESGACVLSLLERDTVLEPHFGMSNGRLICHLPLIVPPGCILTVGGESMEFQSGSPVAFDDTYLHSVSISSAGMRLALIFSVYHPELSPIESALLRDLLNELKIPEKYLKALSAAPSVAAPVLGAANEEALMCD